MGADAVLFVIAYAQTAPAFFVISVLPEFEGDGIDLCQIHRFRQSKDQTLHVARQIDCSFYGGFAVRGFIGSNRGRSHRFAFEPAPVFKIHKVGILSRACQRRRKHQKKSDAAERSP